MARRDEFDDEGGFLDNILRRDGSGSGSVRRVLIAAGGLAAVGILSAIIWSAISSDVPGTDEPVPIIRADSSPYKTTPEEPGGMAVPNKDSTIFNSLKGEKADTAKVENLFEDTETPVRKDEVFTAETSQPPTITSAPEEAREVVSRMPKMPTVTYEESAETAKAVPPVDMVPAKTQNPEASPAQASVPPVQTAAVAPPAAVMKESAKAPVKSEPKTQDAARQADAIQPAAGGNFYVQLASVKSEADAKAQWPKLQAQYGGLSNLPLRVQKADLGAKGTFYRIQGGPVSEADARKLCSTINGQKAGSCVVAKR